MPDFPELTCLPLSSLLFYERHHAQSARNIALRMRVSGILRNPPIVFPIQDGSGHYMVLEGANTIAALRQMGISHTVTQVIKPDHPGLGLYNWNHAIWGMAPECLLDGLRCISGICLQRKRHQDAQPSWTDVAGLVLVKSRDGVYTARAAIGSLEAQLDLLNAIVASYQGRARLERTSLTDTHLLAEIYPSLSALVIFPKFETQDLLRYVGKGCLLPAGIVEYKISPRALHLDYPLDALASDFPLNLLNDVLRKWIRKRIDKKGIRYYAESVYLYDE